MLIEAVPVSDSARVYRVPEPDSMAAIPPAWEPEINRQMNFTAALNAGDTASAEAILSQLDPDSSEYRAFQEQRRVYHPYAQAAGDYEKTEALLTDLEARGRHQDQKTIWRMRLRTALGSLAEPALEHSSPDWRAARSRELRDWGDAQHAGIADLEAARQEVVEWGTTQRAHIPTRIGMIVLMGMPGAGKGTQSPEYANRLGCQPLSTGTVIRQQGTPEQRERMQRGELLTDEEVNKIVAKALQSVDPELTLLDGYPRTVEQAQTLLAALPERVTGAMSVVHLKIDDEVAIKRLLGRAKIEGRADDNAEAIANRLKIYHQTTEPVLAYLESRGVRVITINGEQEPDEVFATTLDQLLQSRPAPIKSRGTYGLKLLRTAATTLANTLRKIRR